MQWPRTVMLAAAGALLGMTGCAGANGSDAAGSPTPAVSSVVSSPPATSPAPPLPALTERQLEQALLTTQDLPEGFRKEPLPEDDEPGVQASSTAPECAPLVELLSADEYRGAAATAAASFSVGEHGSGVEQSLHAMPSADAAARTLAEVRQATEACRSVTVELPGAGASPMQVRGVSAAPLGDESYAARFTATTGPLQGLEVTSRLVREDDVLTQLDFIVTEPAQIDSISSSALQRVRRTLNRGSASSPSATG